MPDEEIPPRELIRFEIEHCGTPVSTFPELRDEYAVLEVDDRYSPRVKLCSLATGRTGVMKLKKALFKTKAALKGVVYVHAGALGGGPRPVRQNDGIAPKTLTFVNLYDDHSPYIDTKVINGSNGEKFNHNLLPTYIMFGNNILPRVDVSMDDANFARDYMISPHLTKSQMLSLIKALKENGGDWGKVPEW